MAQTAFDFSSIFGPKRPKSTSHYIEPAADAVRRDVGASSNVLSEADARALSGDLGAKKARGALDRILASPGVSEGLKKRAKKYYETGNGSLDNSGLTKARNFAGSFISNALGLLDKPKRAVVATEENILSTIGAIDKPKHESWIDRVLHDKSFGYGDVLHEVATQNPDLPGAGTVAEDRFNVATALGLGGDIASDPFTYVAGGVTEAAGGVEKAATSVDDAARAVAEISPGKVKKIDQVLSKLGTSKAPQITERDAHVLFSERALKGDTEAKRLLAKSEHGLGKLTSSELRSQGLKPRLGDVGWAVTRHVGAPFRALDRITGWKAYREVASNFGDARLTQFRDILRDPKAGTLQKANAVLGIEGVKFKREGELFFGHKFGDSHLAPILKDGLDRGVDPEDLHLALNGDQAAIDRVRSTWDKFDDLVKYRVDSANFVNKEGGRAIISEELGNDLPLALNEDALKTLKANSAASEILRTGDLRHLYKNMEIVPGQYLGSADLVHQFGKSLVKQAQGVIESLGGPDQIFELDGFKAIVNELRSNAVAFGNIRGENRLRQLGVLTERPLVVDPEREADLASQVGEVGKTLNDTLEQLGQKNADVVEAARSVQEGGGLDSAIAQYKANIRVLEAHERDAEAAYDAAKAAGANSSKLGRLRREMLAAGRDKLRARRQVRFLKAQSGQSDEDIIRRIGTVQAEPRTSLVDNPIVDPHYSQVEGAMDPTTEAGRIYNNPHAARVEAELRAEQTDNALDDVSPRNTRRRQSVASAKTHQDQVVEITTLMEDDTLDESTRYALGLHAAYHEQAARLDELGHQAMSDEEMLHRLRSQQGQKVMHDIVKSDMAAFGKEFEVVPSYVREGMMKAHATMGDPGEVLKAYDAFIRGFKTYAILTPGFPVRNSFGAFFNNYVAGIDTSSYAIFGRQYKKYQQGWLKALTGKSESALKQVDEQWRPLFAEMERQGQFADANRVVGEIQANINPEIGDRARPLSNWPLTRGMRRVNERVEQYHRGALMFDTLRKSGAADLANGNAFSRGLDRVYKFHFNYSDLSQLEQRGIRRVVPFWVWTSRNLPLQMEQIFRNPRMYARFAHVKDSLNGKDQMALVPDYVRRSPVALFFGSQVLGNKVDYLMPDLPFANVDEQLTALVHNPVQLIGEQAGPAKLPVELYFNQQFFAGIPLSDKQEKAPDNWTKIPGLMEGLSKLKLARRSSNGDWLMSNKNLYAINSVLPTIAQSRRLLPSEDKYNDRWFNAITSFFGIGTKTISERDKTNVLYGRADALQKAVAQERAVGNIAVAP